MDTTELAMELDNEIEEMNKGLTETRDNIDDMMDKIQEHGDEVKKEIDQHYDEMVKKLMKQKDQVKQQVNDTVTQKKLTIAAQLCEVEPVQDKVQGLKLMNDSLKTLQHDESYTKNKQIVNKCFQEVKCDYDKIKLHPIEIKKITVIPVTSTPEVCHLSEELQSSPDNYDFLFPDYICANMEVEGLLLTKGSETPHLSKGGKKVSVQLETSTGKVTPAKIQDNNNGSYTVTFVGKQVGHAKLIVVVDGMQIKGSPYNIALQRNYKALYRPTKIITHRDGIQQPFGIEFGWCGIWAVVDEVYHCVYIFNDNDQLVRKIGKYIGGISKLTNDCHGVAFDASNYLYVIDGSVIKKFNIVGNYILHFGSYGSKDGQLSSPQGITTHNGRVYVADSGNDRISVFHYDGQYSFSFGSDHLLRPLNVAVNTNNSQVLVANTSKVYDGYEISTFTLDGSLISTFGRSIPGINGLKTPRGLTVDNYGFVFVTDDHCRVVIFDQCGNFTHSFGSKGSTAGSFFSCRGIALSPTNGRIYVCDGGNKRIQIFD